MIVTKKQILMLYSLQDRIGRAQAEYESDRGQSRADNLKPLLESCFNDIQNLTSRLDPKGDLC